MANVFDLVATRRARLARASRVARLWRLVVGHLPGSHLPLEYPAVQPAAPERASPVGKQAPDEIDVTSEDSFPASDPPAWTSTRV